MRNSRFIALLIAAGMSPAVVTAQNPAPVKADSQASEAARRAERSRPPETDTTTGQVTLPMPSTELADTIATWDGGSLTGEELSSTLASRTPANSRAVGIEQFTRLPRKQQLEIIKPIAWEQILLQKGREAGITEQTPEIAKAIREHEEALLNRIYYQKQILPRLDELTVEAAKEYYDDNKEEQFTRPAETVMRALHVSTYEMITAEEGDTLNELAREISGDSKAAQKILQASSPFYLRQTPVELEDKVLSSPLKTGEVVLVPLGKDKVSSATQLAERLRRQLINGKTLEEVSAETADADFLVSSTEPLRMSGAEAYWDELQESAATLGDGTSVSEVIQTPAGLNILVLEDQMTTQVVEFEDVKAQLIERVVTDENQRRQSIEETRKEVLDRLRKKYNAKINTDAISRSTHLGPDPLTTSTAIVETGDFKYTLDQYLVDLRLTGKDWGQLTAEERLEVAKTAPRVTNYLTAKEARELGYANTEEFKDAIKGVADAQIVALHRKRIEDPNNNRVTTDELRAYYNDHIDRYTSAAQVTLREISKRINMTLPPSQKAEAIEKSKKSLSEIRSRIKSEEDFAQLARRESEAISTRSRGGLIGTKPDDFRGEAFKNQLRQLKPGEVSEPFLYGSEVMIIRLDDRTAPTVQPFEIVRRQVMLDYAATEPAKIKNSAMEKTLKDAGFKANI